MVIIYIKNTNKPLETRWWSLDFKDNKVILSCYEK